MTHAHRDLSLQENAAGVAPGGQEVIVTRALPGGREINVRCVQLDGLEMRVIFAPDLASSLRVTALNVSRTEDGREHPKLQATTVQQT